MLIISPKLFFSQYCPAAQTSPESIFIICPKTHLSPNLWVGEGVKNCVKLVKFANVLIDGPITKIFSTFLKGWFRLVWFCLRPWNNTDALQWNFQRNVAELRSGFLKIYSYESKGINDLSRFKFEVAKMEILLLLFKQIAYNNKILNYKMFCNFTE